MAVERRHVLAGVVALVATATAVVLVDVLATVFLAITVAYLLTPVARWFRTRGLSPWWASAATSTVAVLGLLVVSVPVIVLLVVRIGSFVGLLRSVPEDPVVLSVLGFTYEVMPSELTPVLVTFVQGLAVRVASSAPVLGIKLTLFGVVLFALLIAGERAKDSVLDIVPADYHDVVESLSDRIRTVLTAIYVVQAGTAIGTFLVGVPVFLVLGYEFPFTLAALSGVLQFLPVVGPSVVIAALVGIDLAAGNVARAVAVVALGWTFVAWLPDPIIRTRLARRAGGFPGSLYFVGFTGGLFSLGTVGIVAGPLMVALLAESASLLAAELNREEDGGSLARKTAAADTVPLGWVPSPFEGEDPSDGEDHRGNPTDDGGDRPGPDE